MLEVIHQLNQLPNAIRSELIAQVGHTAGMGPLQLVAHHRAVAQNLIVQKRSRYEPLAPHGEMASLILDMLQGSDLSFVSGPTHQPFPRWVTHEIVNHLQVFIRNLVSVQTRLEQEAHQLAIEAAHQQAQRQAEEAARQLAQRQAEEAAQLAARQLAEQQAYAAAQALAEQKAQAAAIQAARLALELAPVVTPRPLETALSTEHSLSDTLSETGPARKVVFIPGPAATGEIDRATLVLKQSIDSAVTLYASTIAPYLNTTETSATTAR
ncbi:MULTISPECIES: hypothetical protein [unclassified Pseudomonas]|uniref:hypothetical protein n=1 Tax=unclassified Pseudomonas TaxID=196821 RepID=UPI002600484E|nr:MULTISPECIES: hypothetical protein [unclassified Pseudomonas]